MKKLSLSLVFLLSIPSSHAEVTLFDKLGPEIEFKSSEVRESRQQETLGQKYRKHTFVEATCSKLANQLCIQADINETIYKHFEEEEKWEFVQKKKIASIPLKDYEASETAELLEYLYSVAGKNYNKQIKNSREDDKSDRYFPLSTNYGDFNVDLFTDHSRNPLFYGYVPFALVGHILGFFGDLVVSPFILFYNTIERVQDTAPFGTDGPNKEFLDVFSMISIVLNKNYIGKKIVTFDGDKMGTTHSKFYSSLYNLKRLENLFKK